MSSKKFFSRMLEMGNDPQPIAKRKFGCQRVAHRQSARENLGAAPLLCKGAGFDFPLPKTLRKSPVCSTYSRLTAEPASPSFLPSLPSQMHRWLALVGSFFHAFCPPNESTRPVSASLLPPTVGPAFRGGPLAPSFWHNHSWLCTRSNIAQTRTGKSACATSLPGCRTLAL